MTQNKTPTAPPTFRVKDRTWTINLTVGLIDRVQEVSGVDLMADDRTPYLSLIFAPRQLGGVLWACVAQQAATSGVTREQFVDSLDGDALSAGWGALAEAIVFFSQTHLREAVQAEIDAKIAAMEQGFTALAEVASSEETGEAIKLAVKKLKEDMQADLPRAFAS